MGRKRMNGEHSIYPSGGRWHVQGYIDGKRRRVSRIRRSDAVEAWEALVKLPTPSVTVDGPRTVADAVEQWFTLHSADCKYSTRTGSG
ncbi:MAG: hypothetical protein WCP26_13340 [Actinomycetes bacterium]